MYSQARLVRSRGVVCDATHTFLSSRRGGVSWTIAGVDVVIACLVRIGYRGLGRLLCALAAYRIENGEKSCPCTVAMYSGHVQ